MNSKHHPRFLSSILFLGCILLSASCGAQQFQLGQKLEGIAAYYSDKLHGNKTANGEIYNKNKLTAAHKSLPFGTVVKVTNLSNMKTVIVKINDRGPFGNRKRIIDLSRAAAKRLDMIQQGITEVHVEIIKMPEKKK